MRFFVSSLILGVFFAASTASAAELGCRAADESNQNRKPVAVTVKEDRFDVDLIETNYGEYTITVLHDKGNRFDSQTGVAMRANDVYAVTLNVSEENLYQLILPGLWLQCNFAE